MTDNWIGPKIIIGNTATGEYYFQRPEIEEMIWEEILKGNHVLIAAPRRVGKSSIMQAMLEKHPDNTRCIFENIQSIKSEAEYYQRFYELLVQCLNKFEKGMEWLQNFVKGIAIEEFTLEGVKFSPKKKC